jgi:hypothetical protein
MASTANQQSGGGGTTNKPKGPAKPPAKGKYDWGDGRKVHSISLKAHQAKSRGASTGSAHAGYQPDPVDPLLQSAQQQAASIYAPQVNANASLQASVPTWYADYQTRAAAQAAGQQAYNAPVIAQQQAFQKNIQGPAAGLDPGSAEYAKSQQAGQGLGALAQFSVDNTQANLSTGQQYFAGQASNAARYLPEVRTVLAQQGGLLASQQAGKAQELYEGAKTTAVNQDIAYKTLLGNQANMATDNQQAAADAAQAAADKAAGRDVTTRGQDISAAGRAAAAAAAARKAAAAKRAKAAKEAAAKTAAIQKAVGKAKTKVQDVADAWARGGTMPAPTLQDPNATRPATREELRRLLGGKYGTQWVSIMERRRKGQALTQAQIDYLHNQDPDFRVPKDWKPGKKTTSRPGNAPGAGGYRPT